MGASLVAPLMPLRGPTRAKAAGEGGAEPLARALYATVDIDDEIPVEHYHAVAEIIGYVMGLKRGLDGRRT